MSELRKRIFWWIRNVAVLVMGLGGAMVAYNYYPRIGGLASVFAGAVSTWAASVLPPPPPKEKPENTEILK